MDVTGTDPRTRTGLFLWPWASYPGVAANTAGANNHSHSQANMPNSGTSTGAGLYSNMFGHNPAIAMNVPSISEDPLESFYQRFPYSGAHNMSHLLPTHNGQFSDNRQHSSSRDRERNVTNSDQSSPLECGSRNHGHSRMHSPHNRSMTNNSEGSMGNCHASAIAAFASVAAGSGALNQMDSSGIASHEPRSRHSQNRNPSELVLDNLCNGLSRAGSQFAENLSSGGFGLLQNQQNHGPHSNGSPDQPMSNTSPTDAISTAYNQLRSQQLKAAALAAAVAQGRENNSAGRNANESPGDREHTNSINESTNRTQVASHPSIEAYQTSQPPYHFNSRSPQSDSCDLSREQLASSTRNSMNLMRANRLMSGLTDKSASLLFRSSSMRECSSPDGQSDYRSADGLPMNVRDSSRCLSSRSSGLTPTPTNHAEAHHPGTSRTEGSIGSASNAFAQAAKGYKCKICQHVCFSRQDLSTHNAAIHKQDPRPYRCEQCGRQFTTCAYLSQHRRIHTGVKPYACRFCDRRFTQLSHVQQHERIHTGEKPYRCTTCMKSFTQMSNLQSHQRQHMKGKPHRCEQCFMSFDTKDELDLHVQAKHSGNRYAKVLVCPICSKSYNSETYLAKHLDRHKEAAAGNGNPSDAGNLTGPGVDDLFAAGFPTHPMAMAAAAALSRGAHLASDPRPFFNPSNNLGRAMSDPRIETPDHTHSGSNNGNDPLNYSTENELFHHLPPGLQGANLVAAAAVAQQQQQHHSSHHHNQANLGKFVQFPNRFSDFRTHAMFGLGHATNHYSNEMLHEEQNTKHRDKSPVRTTRQDYTESHSEGSNTDQQQLLNLTQPNIDHLSRHRTISSDSSPEHRNEFRMRHRHEFGLIQPPPAHQDSRQSLRPDRPILTNSANDGAHSYSKHPPQLSPSSTSPMLSSPTEQSMNKQNYFRDSDKTRSLAPNTLEFLLPKGDNDEDRLKRSDYHENRGELRVDVNLSKDDLNSPDSPDSVVSTHSGKLIERYSTKTDLGPKHATALTTPHPDSLQHAASSVVSELAKMLPRNRYYPLDDIQSTSRGSSDPMRLGGLMKAASATAVHNFPNRNLDFPREQSSTSHSPPSSSAAQPNGMGVSPGAASLRIIPGQHLSYPNQSDAEDPIKSSWANRELIPLRPSHKHSETRSNRYNHQGDGEDVQLNSSSSKSDYDREASFLLDPSWRNYAPTKVLEQSDAFPSQLHPKHTLHHNTNEQTAAKRRRRHHFVPQHLPTSENSKDAVFPAEDFYPEEPGSIVNARLTNKEDCPPVTESAASNYSDEYNPEAKPSNDRNLSQPGVLKADDDDDEETTNESHLIGSTSTGFPSFHF